MHIISYNKIHAQGQDGMRILTKISRHNFFRYKFSIFRKDNNMHIKINKHGNKPLSVDCVFETRTIAFSSPGEYMATLLNYDWQAFCNTYAHCTINMDPELLPKLSAEFYQQFSLLSPNLRELVYSLLFEDATYKYFSDNFFFSFFTSLSASSNCSTDSSLLSNSFVICFSVNFASLNIFPYSSARAPK